MDPGGYAWWYIDGLSDDNRHGVTVIAFLGSVFSPYYARRRRRGAADPLDHCAINVALYGGGMNRWSMTERGVRQLERAPHRLAIGPSSLRWDGHTLQVDIDERCAPLPRRIRGRITLTPSLVRAQSYALDASGRHRWTPLAPCARIAVDLTEPRLQWEGLGYLDANRGSEPLEDAFVDWTWSRTATGDDCIVFYDVQERFGRARVLALRFGAAGAVEAIEPPPVQSLAGTQWRVARATRAESAGHVQIVKTLEDAPFYSRTLLQTTLVGQRALTIHESLDLRRFNSGWVQMLLPFRMPRLAR